jgi:hypothetical protein
MISFRGIFFVLLTLIGAHGTGLANEPKGEAKPNSPAQTGEVRRQDAEKWTKLCFSVNGRADTDPIPQHPVSNSVSKACYTHMWLRDRSTELLIAIGGVLYTNTPDRNVLLFLLPLGMIM